MKRAMMNKFQTYKKVKEQASCIIGVTGTGSDQLDSVL